MATTRALILVEGDPAGNGLVYVQAARRLGLHPIILSADPAQYDSLAAEKVEAIRVDTKDLDALIRECSRLRASYDIAGITCAKEWVCATVGKLCRYFELPGPNPASVEECCDKFAQRELLAKAGVPMPAYRVATHVTEVERAAAEMGLPVILKPVVGNGSSGVRLCRTVDEVAEHTTYLLGGTHIWRSSPRILVEDFAQGTHYIAHTMGHEVIGIEAADFDRPPHFVFRQSVFPAVLTSEEHKRIADVSLSCLRALALGWGPANIELRWTKRGPVVIEVNPRLAGDPDLVKLAYGIDLATEHIKLVIGEKCDLRRKHSHTAIWRNLIPDRDGTLDWIQGTSRAAAVPGVVEVKLFVEPKTPIVRKGDFQDSIGHVIVTSRCRTQTTTILQRAIDLISWSITPFDE
ncbi:ATP-grasp domain-containing protein [Sinorhizobium medicae]